MNRWCSLIGILTFITLDGILASGALVAQPQGKDEAGPLAAMIGPNLRNASGEGLTSPLRNGMSVVLNNTLQTPAEAPAETFRRQGNPVVIPDGRVVPVDKQEVPSQRDGTLLLIGTEVPAEKVPDVPPRLLIKAVVGYVGIEFKPDAQFIAQLEAGAKLNLNKPVEEFTGEKLYPNGVLVVKTEKDTKYYRPLLDKDVIRPGELYVTKQTRYFRRLREGDRVAEDQLLAIVDPVKVIDELASKAAKYQSSENEWNAARFLMHEAEQTYRTSERLSRLGRGTVSEEQLRRDKVTWDKYVMEESAKRQAVEITKRDMIQTLTDLRLHEIRSKIPGEVRMILKNRGESVRNLEPVFQIHNPDLVRIEGMVDLQHKAKLARGDVVEVEPYRPERPMQVLTGHLQTVNGVAVSNETGDRGKPDIVSVGEDGTLRVWDRSTGKERWVERHPGNPAIRSVACTPRGAKNNFCFTGAADGTGRLWDLGQGAGKAYWELDDRHRGPINCAAFSADGRYCATGGEDRQIRLWDTSPESLGQPNSTKVKLLFTFPAGHRGRVTWVQFTPDMHLVSMGGDNAMLYWKVSPGSARLEGIRYDQRSGDVAAPGVSPDGKYVLFDQGRELRVLTLPDGRTEGVLQNPSGSMNFTTLALFSPNGKIILAAGGSEGRLQLWRAPEKRSRPYEMRQLIWTGSPATCGAFAPDGSFVVTGMKDKQVLVWPVPSESELNQPKIKARITLVEQSVESSSRQVRVWAEVDNRDGRLVPGTTATIVAEPRQP